MAIGPDALTSLGGYPGTDEAGVEMQRKLDQAKMMADFVSTARYVKARPDSTGRLGAVGFCFGGGVVNNLAVQLGADLQAGVPFYPIYVTSPSIAEEILDYTVTFGCDTLIIGKSRRSIFARRVAGDVVGTVADLLPEEVSLVTRAVTHRHEHGMEHAAEPPKA